MSDMEELREEMQGTIDSLRKSLAKAADTMAERDALAGALRLLLADIRADATPPSAPGHREIPCHHTVGTLRQAEAALQSLTP